MDEEKSHSDSTEEEEPQNREQMKKIQAKFKNNKRTAAHFYHQRYVQIEMRIVYLGAQALLEEYQEALKQQKKGQVSRYWFSLGRFSSNKVWDQIFEMYCSTDLWFCLPY